MIAVGCDAGTVRCGYGIIRSDASRLEYITAGVITAKGPVWRRLLEIGDQLIEVTQEALYALRPGERLAAGIEAGYGEFRQQRQMSTIILGEGRGVAIYVLASYLRVEPREYAPATIKKAVAGHGKADKGQVAWWVRKLLGLRRTPSFDCADALAVAITRTRDVDLGNAVERAT